LGDISVEDSSLITPAVGFVSNLALGSSTFSSLGPSSSEPGEIPIAVSVLHPSALDKIQEYLAQGQRRVACHYATDQKLWAHAMVIASSIDKDTWKEVVNEFIKAELGVKVDMKHPATDGRASPITNGRESLRVAYSMFSGQGAASSLCYLLCKRTLSHHSSFSPRTSATEHPFKAHKPSSIVWTATIESSESYSLVSQLPHSRNISQYSC
jgi:hypothetical protein